MKNFKRKEEKTTNNDKLIIKIDGDDSGFKSKLGGLKTVAEGALKGTATAVTGVATGLAAGTVAAVKFTTDFEQTAAKASTLFGDVNVNVESLNKNILALSNNTGLAATEFNEGLYSALSAGIPVTENMAGATEFLGSSAKLAKAGFTDVDTAISATAKTLNAYGMDVSQAEKIQGILIATQNKGITTVNELGASLSQVTPTAAAFSVSFENVGASLATMTAQGIPTAQATTSLNALIAELGKSGTVAQKGLEKAAKGTEYAGKSFKEMMDSGANIDDVLKLIADEAERNGVSMVDMFSSIEAGKAALSLFTQEGKTFNSNLETMGNTAGEVDKAYEKMANTFQSQTEMMIQGIKNLGIAIISDSGSVLAELARYGNDIVAQLTDAYGANGVQGLVSEIGSVFADVVSKIGENAPKFIDLAVDLINNFVQSIADNSDLIANGLCDAVMAAVNGLTTILPNLVKTALKLATDIIGALAEQMPELLPMLVDTIFDVLIELMTSAPKLIEMGIKLVEGIIAGVIMAIPNLINGVVDVVQTQINNVGSAFTGVEQRATEFSNECENAAIDAAQSYKTVIDEIDGIKTAFDNSVSGVDNVKNAANDYLDVIETLTQKQQLDLYEKNELNNAVSQLNLMYSDLNIVVDEQTGKINLGTDAIRNSINEHSRMDTVAAYNKLAADSVNKLSESEKSYAELCAKRDDAISNYNKKTQETAYLNKMLSDITNNGADSIEKNSDSLHKNLDQYIKLAPELVNFYQTHSDGSLILENGIPILKESLTADEALGYVIDTLTISTSKSNAELKMQQAESSMLSDCANKLAGSIEFLKNKISELSISTHVASDATKKFWGVNYDLPTAAQHAMETMLNAANGASDKIKKTMDGFNAEYDLLNQKTGVGMLTESQYQQELGALLKKYNAEKIGDYNKYYAELYNLQKKSNSDSKNLNDDAKKTLEQFNAEYELLNQKIAIGMIPESQREQKLAALLKKYNAEKLGDYNKYYVELGNLRKKSNDDAKNAEIEQLEQLKKMSEEYASAGDKLLTDHNDIIEKITSENANSVQAILDEYDKFDEIVKNRAKELSNPADMFADDKTTQGFLNNLQNSKNKLLEFQNEYEKLMSNGNISDDLKNEFSKMGVSSLDDLKTLNEMSSSEMQAFNALWMEQQKIANELAEQQLAAERTAAKEKRDEALKAEKENFEKLIAEEENRYNSEIQKLQQQALSDFEKLGKNIGIGINDGILNEKDTIIKNAKKIADELKSVFADAFKDTKKTGFIDEIISGSSTINAKISDGKTAVNNVENASKTGVNNTNNSSNTVVNQSETTNNYNFKVDDIATYQQIENRFKNEQITERMG